MISSNVVSGHQSRIDNGICRLRWRRIEIPLPRVRLFRLRQWY